MSTDCSGTTLKLYKNMLVLHEISHLLIYVSFQIQTYAPSSYIFSKNFAHFKNFKGTLQDTNIIFISKGRGF
jgi:hypothetical protein